MGLDDRVKYQVPGFLTISEERLAKLDGAQLERLNKPGFLHFALFALASHRQCQLADRAQEPQAHGVAGEIGRATERPD